MNDICKIKQGSLILEDRYSWEIVLTEPIPSKFFNFADGVELTDFISLRITRNGTTRVGSVSVQYNSYFLEIFE